MKKDSIGAEPLAISTYGLVPSLEISSYLGIEKKGEKRD